LAGFGTVRTNRPGAGGADLQCLNVTKPDPFRYFMTTREIIRLALMQYGRFPLSLRNVEDLLHERGIDVIDEPVRHCCN
jgi:hypothetical protein